MTDDVSRDLDVHCDLHVQAGDVSARLTGYGRHLRVVTDDAAELWAAGTQWPSGTPRSVLRLVGAAGDSLHDAGLSADVVDDTGLLLELGRGRSSFAGRALTGSRHVRLGRPRLLISTLRRYLRSRRIDSGRARPSGRHGLA